MSGPRWDQRTPNYAAWNFVGALGSSVWLLAVYGLPLWRFLTNWVEALKYGLPPDEEIASHVTLAFGYLILGISGLGMIWVRSRVRPLWLWFRVGAGLVTVTAGVVVSRTPPPATAPETVNYALWAYVMTFVALSAAIWGVLQAVAELRARGAIGPRPLS